MWKPLVASILLFSAVIAILHITPQTEGPSTSFSEQAQVKTKGKLSDVSPVLSISLSNTYDDTFLYYPFDYIVAAYISTTYTASSTPSFSNAVFSWSIDGTQYVGSSVNHTIEGTGARTLLLTMTYGDDSSVTSLFPLSSFYVRREIRSLTTEDREKFFAALETVYFTSTIAGQEIYGEAYRGIDYFLKEHLNGAGQRGCDHWHDDAGIMTHHISFTAEMEIALQFIDPSVSIPYWDYTLDQYLYGADWTESPIFEDDWMSPASSDSDLHIITEGRWAYLPVARNADEISDVYNPYGLLRSPWNTNPVPYVTRYEKVLHQRPYTHFPTCYGFYLYYEKSWIGEINAGLNGALHGPVHIMIGGHWNDYDLDRFGNAVLGRSIANFLLISKNLWRMGYITCPTTCDQESTDVEDCKCYCPAKFTEGYDAYEFLTMIGQLEYLTVSNWLVYNETTERYMFPGYSDIKQNELWEGILKLICSFGHAGEMFTSAAPYDPTFWLIHTSAERFLQLRRFSSYYGTNSLNETWGYDHTGTAPSDFGKVCHWNNVSNDSLPHCSDDTCFGHHQYDELPQTDLIAGHKKFTNIGYYDFIDPRNSEMPYIYDNFNMDHCSLQEVEFIF